MSRRRLGTFMLVLASVLSWHRPVHAQGMMACAADKEKFWPDVPMGGGRVADACKTAIIAHGN